MAEAASPLFRALDLDRRFGRPRAVRFGFLDRAFVLVPIQTLAAQFLATMKDYPPSQTPGSFNLSKIEESLKSGLSN